MPPAVTSISRRAGPDPAKWDYSLGMELPSSCGQQTFPYHVCPVLALDALAWLFPVFCCIVLLYCVCHAQLG